jgi:hypothetical protein
MSWSSNHIHGTIIEHYWNHGQIDNSAWYCAMLKDDVKPIICSKCREMLTNGIVLFHDNTQSCMAAVTAETSPKLKFKLLPLPVHSPDLVPPNYQISGPLKDQLCRSWFAKDDDVKDTVHTWLHMKLKTFFTSGTGKLMDWSNKCVEKLRDYVEKWHYTRYGYEVPGMTLMQAHLYTFSLLRGITFKVLPFSSYTLSPKMLPLLETFLKLLLWKFLVPWHFLDVFNILKF